MYTFDPGLFVSKGLKEKKMKLCESFMQGRAVPDVFVIYRNENTGRAEFTSGKYLKQRYYEDKDIHILGLSEDYETALHYLAISAAESVGE